jgi:hypothetical protein
MLGYKVPVMISSAVIGAYAMPLSTNRMLLVAQAVFGICVSFALFMVMLHAAGHRGDRRAEERLSRRLTARRELRRAARHPQPGSLR